MGIFQRHCMPHLQEQSLLQPHIDEQLAHHLRFEGKGAFLWSTWPPSKTEGIAALLFFFRSSSTPAFRVSLYPFLSSSSAGYGDDLIVTVISIQLSMACNILWRNRPRVGRYLLCGVPRWLRNDYTETGCFILYKHWYIMSSLSCSASNDYMLVVKIIRGKFIYLST